MKTSALLKKMGVIRPPLPWHQPRVRGTDGDTVILLHGLWRSIWAMDPMAKFLHQQGYHTVNLPYPSFRKSLDELTVSIEGTILNHIKEGKKVHFVTHSLGGILVRRLLHRLLNQLPAEQLGRVVMLAPPNQGCEIVDWLESYPLLKSLLGPSGATLGYGAIEAPTIPEQIDAAVIMGNQSIIPFFQSVLDSENDGIVSVKSGQIEGMNEFQTLDVDHTLITADEQVMQLTIQFLNSGALIPND